MTHSTTQGPGSPSFCSAICSPWFSGPAFIALWLQGGFLQIQALHLCSGQEGKEGQRAKSWPSLPLKGGSQEPLPVWLSLMCVRELGPQSFSLQGAWEINLFKKAGQASLPWRRVQKGTSISSSKKYSGTKARRTLLPFPLPRSCQLPSKNGGQAALLLCEGQAWARVGFLREPREALSCFSGSSLSPLPHSLPLHCKTKAE